LPNSILAFSKPEEVKAHCKKLIETIGADGGYIMDASAIMQNDVTLENLKAMTDAAREFGVYHSPSASGGPQPAAPLRQTTALPDWAASGVCVPFEQKARELPPIIGDYALTERVGNEIEGLAHLYIWHVLLSF
jgi:hypothetical protein